MNERGAWSRWLAGVALIVVLGIAVLVGSPGGLSVATPNSPVGAQFAAAFDGVAADAVVLVGFDPDLGTYAEIRPTVRTALADLLDRGARLAVVSLTPEGRALALGELARLGRSGIEEGRIIDLGFRPGAEAALIGIARSIEGEAADALGGAPSLAADRPVLALVVGGNDLGPRSWVEQVEPRVDGMPFAAIAPTSLLPEVRPYLASGQLVALVATPREGAAYRAAVALGAGAGLAELDGPPALALLIGMLVAIAAIGLAVMRRLLESAGATRARESS